MTGTGTSVFSQAHIDAYIRKKTLELGARKYLWRKFVNKERIEPGNGAVWKAVRYLRLDVPLTGLTEGVAPTETDLAIEVITCTATQYGLTVKITDVLMLTIASQPLQKAIEKKADVMAALDDSLIGKQALTNANVFYGGTASARNGLNAAGGDVITTTLLRKAVAALRATDGVKGRAPEVAGVGKYVGLIHEKQVFDVQKDTTWEGAAVRQPAMLEELRTGMVKEWVDVAWYSSDFLPVFDNLCNGNSAGFTGITGAATPVITNGTIIAGTRGLNGLKITDSATSGSLTGSTAYFVKVTRTNRKRGYEEGVSSICQISTGSAKTALDFIMPSDTNYFYTVYFGATNANASVYRSDAQSTVSGVAAVNLAAGATFTLKAVPLNTNPNPPVEPPRDAASTTSSATFVYSCWVFGGDALAVVDLQDLESYMVRGPDSGNPLNQFTLIGSKFMEGTIILQDAFIQRIESQSAFGV